MKALFLALSLSVSSLAFANGAVHMDDFGCGLLDGNGGFVYTTDSRVTITPSNNNVTILKCTARGVANNTGSAAHFDHASTGYPCNTQAGSTYDWHETVSANGVATLTCKVRN
jgi:hypothetical protein